MAINIPFSAGATSDFTVMLLQRRKRGDKGTEDGSIHQPQITIVVQNDCSIKDGSLESARGGWRFSPRH